MLKTIPNITHSPQIMSQHLPYATSLALSLILYAKYHKEFAAVIETIAQKLTLEGEHKRLDFKAPTVQLLFPLTQDQAIKRIHWLQRELENKTIDGFQEATALLKNWEEVRIVEEPKNIVVGFIRVAIPGITLGRFKMVSKISCIASVEAVKSKAIELSKDVTQATNELIAQAFVRANYNLQQVEPEVLDWLFGDRDISFFKTSNEKLKTIKKELDHLNILHTAIEKDGKLSLIIISPSANSEAQEAYWDIQEVE